MRSYYINRFAGDIKRLYWFLREDLRWLIIRIVNRVKSIEECLFMNKFEPRKDFIIIEIRPADFY